MKYIVRLQDRVDRRQVGGKAYPLAQLLQRGFFVPSGFVLTPAAFDASLTRHQRETLRDWQYRETVEVRELQNLLATLHLGEVVQSEILQILVELFPYGGQFAVRSSAIEEDQQEYSLAGQLKTFLAVTPENLGQQITQVWQSAYRETVMLYRQRQGLNPLPEPPAVLVQQMLNPSVSGVAFGADPVTGRRNVRLISAVYGLGTTLVSGEQDADTFYLDARDTIIQRQLAYKVQGAYPNPLSESGVSMETIDGDRAEQPTLTDAQVLEVGQLVRRASQELASPQDIEWAIAETGQLYLLQSRPITALPSTPEPTGLYQIWDNSNIAESYSGVTTPLTFTFARRAYTEVYRQFCRLMGISPRTIQRRDRVFTNMIGLMRGRIYYNLLNWYRVLAMLPGFKLNRQFMEQMMGVKEPLPEAIVADIAAKSRWQDGWDAGRSLFSLLSNYLVLPFNIWRFKGRLKHILETEKQDLSYLRVDQLVDYYARIERAILPHWQAPIVNDFFAMISYGILRKVTAAWCDDHNGSLANTLVQQPGQMISAEPARRIQAMAQLIQENSALVDTFCTGEVSEINAILKHHSELATQYQSYLDQFSDRCLDELKLESPTLQDNPLPLLRTIGLVARDKTPRLSQPSTQSLPFKRQFRQLGWRRFVLSWVVSSSRKRLRDRENLRFERTRVFGLARQIFLELGRRFFALDVIQHIQDIFYLEVGEIIRFVEGTSTCTDLKSLVALRRAEFDRYRQTEPPSDRHCTYGIPYLYRDPTPVQPALVHDETQRQGIGCSPGIVRGVVTIIRNPQVALTQSNRIPAGAIVVAERTDPGWILLFAAAAGLIVERGSLLSHAAIVSRELGLPAIVSATGVMDWLKEGDWVEMDGSTGQITKVARSH